MKRYLQTCLLTIFMILIFQNCNQFESKKANISEIFKVNCQYKNHNSFHVDIAGTGGSDGFSLWLVGDTTSNTLEADRVLYIYDPEHPEEAIKQYTARDLHFSEHEQGDAISFAINDPFSERIFMRKGLLIQYADAGAQSCSNQYLVKWERNKVVMKNTYEDIDYGSLRKSLIEGLAAWNPGGISLFTRYGFTNDQHKYAEITEHPFMGVSNRVLTIRHPSGLFGPLWGENGSGFVYSASLCQDSECHPHSTYPGATESRGYEELYLQYWVRFQSCDINGGKFDFRGGKLPGFYGGYQGVAGGGGQLVGDTGLYIKPNGRNGWSARAMFGYYPGEDYANPRLDYGSISQYIYHADHVDGLDNQRPAVSDPSAPIYGDTVPWLDVHGNVYKIYRDRWYRIRMYIKMNTITNDLNHSDTSALRDGRLEVFVDNDRVLYKEDIRYRLGVSPTGQHLASNFDMNKVLDIDGLAFNVFYGGGDFDWAPDVTGCIQFDDLYIFTPHK